MNKFLIEFKKEIALKYNMIILYQNDIYSYFAYKIIKNALISLKKDNNIFILGKVPKEEKNLFSKENVITKIHSKKKKKKDIVITGFNPIYNVIDISKLSKDFDKIYHPLQTMPPEYIDMLIEYYVPDKSCLLNQTTDNIKELKDKYYCSNVIINEKNPFVCYELTGSEKDFPIYNYILQHQDKINLYIIPPEGEKFVKTNLGFYIMGRNYPNEFNIVTKDVAEQICNYNEDKDKCFYSWEQFGGDE